MRTRKVDASEPDNPVLPELERADDAFQIEQLPGNRFARADLGSRPDKKRVGSSDWTERTNVKWQQHKANPRDRLGIPCHYDRNRNGRSMVLP